MTPALRGRGCTPYKRDPAGHHSGRLAESKTPSKKVPGGRAGFFCFSGGSWAAVGFRLPAALCSSVCSRKISAGPLALARYSSASPRLAPVLVDEVHVVS